jgi:hypothetical protein
MEVQAQGLQARVRLWLVWTKVGLPKLLSVVIDHVLSVVFSVVL